VSGTEVVPTELPRGHLRALQAVNTVSSLDRSSVAPMLLVIAADLHTSVARVTVAASLYYLSYGLLQPGWGIVSARLGTVRTLRVALVGSALAGLLSALSPGVGLLAVLRFATGGFFGGAIPATLVYVGARCRSSVGSSRSPTSWPASPSGRQRPRWRPAGRRS
jgi:MFS family permease